MKKVIILVGNIGTGKSTFTKKYQKRGYIIISRDLLRYAIGGGKYIFNLDYEPIIWETELYMFDYFLELGVNILIDEVGITERMRARYIELAKSCGYKVHCIIMPKLSMKEAVSRRMKNPHQQNDRKLWEKIWKTFDKKYENPTKKEDFDKIIKLKGGKK